MSTIEWAAAASAVTTKLVLEMPWATVTLAGAANAVFELEIPMARLPAGFDSATVQLLVAPTAILVGVQASDDRPGVDHSNTVVFCEEAPRVALTTAWVFDGIVPAVAVALPAALPAKTVSARGIESREEVEFSETVVSVETVCESVTEQVMLTPDMTPIPLQATPETSTGATRLMAAFWELLPRVAVTVAL